MEDVQRQFSSSEQCLSLKVEDELMASEIRFNRKQLQEDYDILIKAFECFQEKRTFLLKHLLGGQDEEVSINYKKQLHCLSDVVEEKWTPAIPYTREHLEKDYNTLMNAFKDLQEDQACCYSGLSRSKAEKERSLADLNTDSVEPGEVQDLFMASGMKYTRQQLTEDQDTLIKALKALQDKHADLFKDLSGRNAEEDKELTDSKKHWHDKYQRGLSKDEYQEFDALINACKDLQTKQMCLSEQEKQEELRKQHERGVSIDEYYRERASDIETIRRSFENQYDDLIYTFRQLQTNACLLDQQMCVQIRQEGDIADFEKQQHSEFRKGLSGESDKELYLYEVAYVREELETDYDTLIQAFKDFQARQKNLLEEQTAKHLKQGENQSGLKRQYRTEYERGLSNIVKERWLQAEIPDLDIKIDLLINARKNLQAEVASWLDELHNRQPVEGMVDVKKQMDSIYQKDKVDKVSLPQDVHLELEGTIESLVRARKNLEKEEACLLEKLSRHRAEEEVQIVSKKQCPSNKVKHQLTQAVNPELTRTFELLIHVRKNLEEACLMSKQCEEEEEQIVSKK